MKRNILNILLGLTLLLFITSCGSSGGGSNEPLQPESTEPQFHSKDKIEILPNQDKVIELNVTDNGNEDDLEYSLIGEDSYYFRVNVSTGIIYVRGNVDHKNIYHFTAVAKDFVGNKGKQDITVTIIRNPIFTSSNKISVKENQVDVVTVKTESVSRVTYALSGTDANNFNIDSSSGIVTFESAPNYEVKKTYSFKVTATDGQNRSSSQMITVTILNVNETVVDTQAPIFTSSNSVSVQENQTKALTVKATDINSISYALSGTDSQSFTINSTTGVITFKTAPDYETKKSYIIIITARDSKNNSDTQTISITILDIKEVAEVSESDYFITTWKTDNNGTSNNNQITIPTNHNYFYNYSVDWGDGNSDTGVTGDVTHTYDSVGIYTIKILGVFPAIEFIEYYEYEKKFMSDANKILSIEQWGKIQWESMYKACAGCSNLIGNFNDTPNLSQVYDMSAMFSQARSFNSYIGNWDVSNIRTMDAMFYEAIKYSQDMKNWNTTNVTNMSHMFSQATSFNQDIGSWDVSKVKNMSWMFSKTKFNYDVGNWNVSNVLYMTGMLSHLIKFNQDIGNWNVSNVIEMNHMFSQSLSFNQDIENWNTSNVTHLNSMFHNASSFSNHNLSLWNVSKVVSRGYFSEGWGTGNTEPNWNQ